jgi:NAD(P)-dependent dehydrogenase (short-subunit alcohol dehydrogenase family)
LLDVTKANTIQAAIGYIVDQFGRLDILVNNAGIMIDTETNVMELDLTLFQNTLETNALGPLLLSQACVPHMRPTITGGSSTSRAHWAH